MSPDSLPQNFPKSPIKEARQERWITVLIPGNEPLLSLLKRDLDEGEAEAIALAIEQQADIIFIDELEARSVADLYKLQKTGVVGTLIRARLQGKIDRLRTE